LQKARECGDHEAEQKAIAAKLRAHGSLQTADASFRAATHAGDDETEQEALAWKLTGKHMQNHKIEALTGSDGSPPSSATSPRASKGWASLQRLNDLVQTHHFDAGAHGHISTKQDTSVLDRAIATFEREVMRLGSRCTEQDQQAVISAKEVETLAEKLKEMDLKLAVASIRPALDLIDRIKTIEARGNVKVDLGNGDVDILKPISFQGRNKNQKPTAEFLDMGLVNTILFDIAEVANMFSVPMEIQGHTGGEDCAFSQALSLNRAELILDHLAIRGVEKRLMTPKGYPGPTGLNKACVVVSLDIFPDTD